MVVPEFLLDGAEGGSPGRGRGDARTPKAGTVRKAGVRDTGEAAWGVARPGARDSAERTGGVQPTGERTSRGGERKAGVGGTGGRASAVPRIGVPPCRMRTEGERRNGVHAFGQVRKAGLRLWVGRKGTSARPGPDARTRGSERRETCGRSGPNRASMSAYPGPI